MRIELPFNETVFFRRNRFYFDITWAAFLKSNRQRLIWVALAAFFGGLLIYDGNSLGWLVLGVGIQILINFSNGLNQYKHAKKLYESKLEKYVEEYSGGKSDSYCELQEDYFLIVYPQFESKIKWSYFEGYRIIEDTLFLDMDIANGHSFLVSRSEIEEYEWLALREKLGSELDDLLPSSE